MNQKLAALFLFAVLTGAAVAADEPAETPALKLPQSSDDVRKLMAPTDARCPGCGVVTNVRQLAPQRSAGRVDGGTATARTGDAGPGEDIKPLTIAGSGDQSAKARRNKAAKAAPRPWEITVRYDDGSYASFEQDDVPRVVKGQRVQVLSGRVEPR